MPNVSVPIEPAAKSKINWTQLIAPIVSILSVIAGKQIELSPDQILAIVLAIQSGQSMITAVFKTWFTKSVTPSAASGLSRSR